MILKWYLYQLLYSEEQRFSTGPCEKNSVNSKTEIKTLLSERLYSAAQIFLQYTMDTVICQDTKDISLLEWSAAEWNRADIRRISPACQDT